MTGDDQDILERAGEDYEWGEEQIQQRGQDMVRFVCGRWDLPGQDDDDSELQFDYVDVLSANV